MKKALIVQGGWEGHEPFQVGDHFKGILENNNFKVTMSDTLDAFLDENLKDFDLIVPIWTMGEITNEQFEGINQAIQSGVGLAGCHGGMCDAFRQNTEWEFMTGGTWVSHPGGDGTEHWINFKKSASDPMIEGLEDFTVSTEQYYLHVDPVVNVLATTRFPTAGGPHASNGVVDVPAIWTKKWGKGRVFYTSLGHVAEIAKLPVVTTIMERGFNWAVR